MPAQLKFKCVATHTHWLNEWMNWEWDLKTVSKKCISTTIVSYITTYTCTVIHPRFVAGQTSTKFEVVYSSRQTFYM